MSLGWPRHQCQIRAQRHRCCSCLSRIRHPNWRACAKRHTGCCHVLLLWCGPIADNRTVAELHTDNMEPTEIQARATIAAALIVSRAVEVPSIPTSGDWSQDTAALRLRDLTDYVYQMITTGRNR